MPVFLWQSVEFAPPHVGRVTDDNIVGTLAESVEMIGLHGAHPSRQAMSTDIDTRHLERVSGNIGRIHQRARKCAGAGDRDAPRPCSQIEDATDTPRLDPGLEAPLDQFGQRRARDQHARIDMHAKTGKPALACQIDDRHPLANPPLEQGLEHGPSRDRHAPAEFDARVRGEPQCVSQQCRGVIAGVVGAVPIVQARSRQAPATTLQQPTDRYTCTMNRRMTLVFALVAVAAALGGVTAARLLGGHGNVNLTTGTWLPTRRPVAEFHLQDLSGHDFSLLNLQGHPTLLFFGFTHCPDVCPTTLATLAQTERAKPLPGSQVVFISIDPQRDSAATMSVYLGAFSKDFIGARGDDAALAPVLKSLGAIAEREQLPDGSYIMDHSATLYLLDTQGRLAAVFSPPFKTAELTADLTRIATAATL